MAERSSKKTTFAGPGGRNFHYLVIPFGLVNRPPIFIIVIYYLKSHWDQLALKRGVTNIGTGTGSTIIIDDTFGFSDDLEWAFVYLEAILEISKRYNLSWKLEKCDFFSPHIESVGTDIDVTGNRPANYKTPLMQMWKDKKPETIRYFSYFIGLVGYYRSWIPLFEELITTIRSLMLEQLYDYHLKVSDLKIVVFDKMYDILNAIFSDMILRRADGKKLFYLRTDDSSKGYSNSLLHPGDESESIAAMNR